MPPAPTVSVLIPTFNGAAFIGEAIGSVLAQTFDDFEVVVVDDGSSDATPEIVGTVPDSRVRLLRNEANVGFGANWNRCLREARGALIKLLPQDDVLAAECLSTQVRIMRSDTGGRLALTFSARTIIGPDGARLFRRGWGRDPRVLDRKQVIRRVCWLGTNPIGEPGGVLFRKSAAKSAGSFNEGRPFVIDIDYWLRLLQFGDAAFSPEPLCDFRVSGQSQSVRMTGHQATEFSEFVRGLQRLNPAEVSQVAMLAGMAMARANAWGRKALYFMATRGGKRGQNQRLCDRT